MYEKGKKEFKEWFEDQPEDFQEDWEENTEKYKDQFKKARFHEGPKGKKEWALDTVTMNEAEEFSQEHLGEQIVSHRVIDEADLVVPHPRLHDRRFVLMPLNELDPLLVHPSLQRTATQLLADSTDRSEVRLLFPQPSTRYGSRPSCSPHPDL